MKVKLTRAMFIRAADECEQLNAEISYRERLNLGLCGTSHYSCAVISHVAAAEWEMPVHQSYAKLRPVRDLYSKWMSPGPDPSWTFWLDEDTKSIDPKVLRPMLLLFAGEVLDGVEVDIDVEDKE